MGAIYPVTPVKLFAGIIAGSPALAAEAEERIAAAWGPIDDRSELVPFTFTEYYKKEMGESLLREWVSFERLIDPGELAKIKIAANEHEAAFVTGAGRRVNIDPGYITMAKLVLASTKDYSHRIYLSSGIYAEVTMIYQHHRFIPLPWTYPDYQSPAALTFFERIRAAFHRQLHP